MARKDTSISVAYDQGKGSGGVLLPLRNCVQDYLNSFFQDVNHT